MAPDRQLHKKASNEMKISQKMLVSVITSIVRLHRWAVNLQAEHDTNTFPLFAATFVTALVILTNVVSPSTIASFPRVKRSIHDM